MTITFNIPAEHVTRVIEAINALYPKGTEPFTPQQWAKEVIRRHILRIVRRHEWRAAQQAIVIDVPDDLVS